MNNPSDDVNSHENSINNNGATSEPVNTEPKRRGRGFASMDAERQREIASLGGKAAHLKGTAHVFTREEASAAGLKGGRPPSRHKKTENQNH